MKSNVSASWFIRLTAFIIGLILLVAGGVTFAITTLPGIALVIWSLTGYGLKDK